jgi:hypothetical protein
VRRVAILIFVASGCAPRGAASTPVEGAPAPLSGSPAYAVTLYRSPCSDRCPVYSVAVTTNGFVSYEGRQLVRRPGSASAWIPKPRVDSLLWELEAAGYFTFASRYRPSERVCGRYTPSYQTAITSMRLGERRKRIEHDYGCGGAPPALAAMERRIDEVLGSDRWTGN